jgi:hypothetical protein
LSEVQQDINSKTVGGTVAFCDWMMRGGYGTASQVNPWKIAIKKVFETVEGEDYESFNWADVDLDEYLDRFQRIAGVNYKAESVIAYGRRVRNAFEAHRHYLDTGRAPASKPAAKRKKVEKPDETDSGSVTQIDAKRQQQEHVSGASADMVTFPYPLDGGKMASLTIPPRLKPSDVDRLCAFIRTLQDDQPARKQLLAGQQDQAA